MQHRQRVVFDLINCLIEDVQNEIFSQKLGLQANKLVLEFVKIV